MHIGGYGETWMGSKEEEEGLGVLSGRMSLITKQETGGRALNRQHSCSLSHCSLSHSSASLSSRTCKRMKRPGLRLCLSSEAHVRVLLTAFHISPQSLCRLQKVPLCIRLSGGQKFRNSKLKLWSEFSCLDGHIEPASSLAGPQSLLC